VDIHTNQNEVAVGGADGTVRIFSKSDSKVVSELKGHSGAITSVLFDKRRSDRDVFYSCSADSTVRLWSRTSADAGYTTAAEIKTHSGPVTGITTHATGQYVVTSSEDGSWAFHDVSDASAVQLYTKATDAESGGFASVQFHPDGVLLGTGTVQGKIQIFDLKSAGGKPVAAFKADGRVSALSFSQNGYYMASGVETAAGGGVVKLWDLRKGDMLVKSDILSKPVRQVIFDSSGTYLSIAADTLRLKYVKGWSELSSISAHSSAITGVAMAHDSTFLASSSLDGTLVFSAAQ